SFVPHVVVVTRCVRGFEQRAVQSNASVAPTSQINPRKTPPQGKGLTIFWYSAWTPDDLVRIVRFQDRQRGNDIRARRGYEFD
ncbi:MAG TPA: hypothetical protein VEY94_05115, partial [Patescibacteria group bacterium]|nr:hypothetical protein [Patescibacteria group bacterium]